MPEDKTKRREQARIRSAMKQRESKRLRMAQSIQRELEEVAVKQADLEKEGIVVEKALRSGNSEWTFFCPKCLMMPSNFSSVGCPIEYNSSSGGEGRGRCALVVFLRFTSRDFLSQFRDKHTEQTRWAPAAMWLVDLILPLWCCCCCFSSSGWSRRASFNVTVVQIGEQEERPDTIRVRARYSVRAPLLTLFHCTLVPRAVVNCCFSNQPMCVMLRLYYIRDQKNSRYKNQGIFHCVVIYQAGCGVHSFLACRVSVSRHYESFSLLCRCRDIREWGA